MAVKTFYLTDTDTDGYGELSETPPTSATTSPNAGWTVAKTAAARFSPFVPRTEQAAGTFGTTILPAAASLSTSAGGFRTAALNGTFASGTWSFTFEVTAVGNGGTQDGNFGIRLYRSANADGSGATEITAARQESTIATNLATAATTELTLSFNPGAITLSDEYLFVQVAWEITGAGGNNNCDVILRIGANETRIATTDFTASSNNYTADVNETVSLSESVAAAAGFASGPAETVSLSEAAAATYAAVVGLAETDSLSESLATQATMADAVGETVSQSDALAAGLALLADVGETVSLSEAQVATLGAVVAPGETVTLSESATALAAFAPGVAETVSLVEAVVAAYAAVVGLGETDALSESVTAEQGGAGPTEYTADVSETVPLSEALATTAGMVVATAETVTFSDAAGVVAALVAALAESASVAEALASQAAQAIAVAESVALAESLSVPGAAVAITYEVVGGIGIVRSSGQVAETIPVAEVDISASGGTIVVGE